MARGKKSGGTVILQEGGDVIESDPFIASTGDGTQH